MFLIKTTTFTEKFYSKIIELILYKIISFAKSISFVGLRVNKCWNFIKRVSINLLKAAQVFVGPKVPDYIAEKLLIIMEAV